MAPFVPPAPDPDETYSVYHNVSYDQLAAGPAARAFTDESFVFTTRLLQASCSKCDAGPLAWCTLPNGRLYSALHMQRWQDSKDQGWFDEGAELTVPLRF